MPKKERKTAQPKKTKDGKNAQAYDHKEEKLLLRPDVGLQPQFKQKKLPKTYRYDPSLDPALSWDINADRERAEALIAKIEKAKDIAEAKLGFAIPYSHNCEAKEYIPDFLIRLQMDGRELGTLILETKGYDPMASAKEAGAHRWVAAVNADCSHGRGAYRLIKSPTDTPEAVRSAANELART